jgi:dihydroneopterin aldolase
LSGPPHLVAKLGGSLWRSPLLGEWIAALRRFPHPLTIVPGGGPFADAVRAAQPVMGFSETAAHGMAVLGMEQYALALADVHGLALAGTLHEMRRLHEAGEPALWRPSTMVGAAPSVRPGWDVTSDSLAAWLAHELGASALLLIKSVDARDGEDLTARGLVDFAFASHVKDMPAHIAGPAALGEAADIFARGEVPGTWVDFGCSPR